MGQDRLIRADLCRILFFLAENARDIRVQPNWGVKFAGLGEGRTRIVTPLFVTMGR